MALIYRIKGQSFCLTISRGNISSWSWLISSPQPLMQVCDSGSSWSLLLLHNIHIDRNYFFTPHPIRLALQSNREGKPMSLISYLEEKKLFPSQLLLCYLFYLLNFEATVFQSSGSSSLKLEKSCKNSALSLLYFVLLERFYSPFILKFFSSASSA